MVVTNHWLLNAARGLAIVPACVMPGPAEVVELWMLRLYVAAVSLKSMAAQSNLRRICEKYLSGCYALRGIDLLVSPSLADAEAIIPVPALIRKLPIP